MAKAQSDDLDGLATEDTSQRKPRDSSADSSIMGAISAKACCICGVDVHGRMRYKDSGGRYWCPSCNEKDQMSRQPATCPDCNVAMTRVDLVEFKGTAVCPQCWEKRRASSRREEARIRAIEEEVREQEERKRRLKMIAMGFVVLIVIWLAAMTVFWLLARH
jgi:hypothetical protein